MIELAAAAAGAAIAAQISQISLIWLIGLILIATALIWIFFSDLINGAVPDWAVVVGSLGAFLYNAKISPLNLLLAGAASAGFFLLLVGVTRGRGMGSGDVSLSVLIGLLLGWPEIITGLWLAFLLGAFVAVILILLKKKRFGQSIPFGPFLIVAAIAVMVTGFNLLPWVVGK